MPLQRIGIADIHYVDDDFADPWKPHDTVLMQHGFGRSGAMFYGWVPHLAREFRVVRKDLRGLGRSGDLPADYCFTLDDLVGDFVGLMDALGIGRVHYIGESLGGLLGIAFAARHPDRVKSLTLVATITQVNRNTTGTALSLGYANWADAMQARGMRNWWLESRAATGELTGDAAKDGWFADECAVSRMHVAQALSRVVPTISVASMLGDVRAPTLVLTPGKSRNTGAEEQRLMATAIPDARQIVYPEGQHMDCYLQPDRIAQDTFSFLREVNQRDPLP